MKASSAKSTTVNTGFGLARFLTGQGIDCQVAAPSKLQRPSGDRLLRRHGVDRYARRVAARPAPITKTGNGHARRLLIEAAWHHRPPNRTVAELRRRQPRGP
jgi:hypothetical protein